MKNQRPIDPKELVYSAWSQAKRGNRQYAPKNYISIVEKRMLIGIFILTWITVVANAALIPPNNCEVAVRAIPSAPQFNWWCKAMCRKYGEGHQPLEAELCLRLGLTKVEECLAFQWATVCQLV